MGFPTAGVIEGFYGTPWRWDDRFRLVDFLARHGLDTYAYAPKNDPLHRDRWREPYLPEEQARFAELQRRCAAAGIDVVFGISPLGFRFDDADARALELKLAAADAVGIRRYCLLVDDMPARGDGGTDESSAAADVELVRIVHAALGRLGDDRRLWFVPQPYCGDTDTPYLRRLGREVPGDVAIAWTGPDVVPAEIPLPHIEEVAETLRRPPLLWDNHPVNDGGMRHDPHLGPLRGRDPRLPERTAGIVANLALQPEASRIAVATIAAYATDPAAYDPEAAWREALAAVTGDAEDAAAVAALADLARRTPLEPGRRDNALTPAIAAFRERWQAGASNRAIEELEPELAALAIRTARLARLANRRLAADLRPWSEKADDLVVAARDGLEVLRRALREAEPGGGTGAAGDPDGDAAVAGLRQEVLVRLERAHARPHWVAGDTFDVFARACLRTADELLGRMAPVAAVTR